LDFAGLDEPAFIAIVDCPLEKQRHGLKPGMGMRSAHRTISDIKMVVHQGYEWIRKPEVVGRDDRRC
jgi:hypothetical protein